MKTGILAVLFAMAAPFAVAVPVNSNSTLVARDTLNVTVVLDTKREAAPSYTKERSFVFKPRDLHVKLDRSLANGIEHVPRNVTLV